MSGRRPDRVRLYRMAAARLLGALPRGSIHVLVTDPPYTTVSQSGGGHLRSWFKGGLSWRQIGDVLAIARQRMAPDGIAFVMTNGAGLREAIEALERAGFERIRPIVWDRRTPGLGMGLRHQTEYVLVGYLPGSRTLQGIDLVSVSAVGPGTADRYPTQKPDGLGRALARIAALHRGDLVVDPFCGSGALLVGAAGRGAVVVGSDISARAVSLAKRRLTAAAPARPPTSLDGRRRPRSRPIETLHATPPASRRPRKRRPAR